MTTKQRTEMLSRFDQADAWLRRVYDPQRSDQHRIGLWNFLMKASDRKLRNIIVNTRTLDELAADYWNGVGKN